jgi:hypothetical protein
VGHPGGIQVIDLEGSPHAPIISTLSLEGDQDAVEFSNDFAYVSKYDFDTMFSGMEIIDMRDPVNPVSIAIMDTPEEVYTIEVRGQYAFAIEKSTGLLAIDISDPGTPQVIGALGETSYALNFAVEENYAFIPGREPTLKIVDISDPTHPTLLSELDTSGYAIDLFVIGNYVYLTIHSMSWKGLHVVDISDPTPPVHVGSLKLIDWVESIVVKDDLPTLAGALLVSQIS